jgi:hypothetical protein
VYALGDALAGTGRPLVTASGTGGQLGRPATEQDAAHASGRGDVGTPRSRTDSEIAVVGFAERGVRSSVVRIPPITHSTRDRIGIAKMLIAIAKEKGHAGQSIAGLTYRGPSADDAEVEAAGRLYCLVSCGTPGRVGGLPVWHCPGHRITPAAAPQSAPARAGRRIGE